MYFSAFFLTFFIDNYFKKVGFRAIIPEHLELDLIAKILLKEKCDVATRLCSSLIVIVAAILFNFDLALMTFWFQTYNLYISNILFNLQISMISRFFSFRYGSVSMALVAVHMIYASMFFCESELGWSGIAKRWPYTIMTIYMNFFDLLFFADVIRFIRERGQ